MWENITLTFLVFITAECYIITVFIHLWSNDKENIKWVNFHEKFCDVSASKVTSVRQAPSIEIDQMQKEKNQVYVTCLSLSIFFYYERLSKSPFFITFYVFDRTSVTHFNKMHIKKASNNVAWKDKNLW